MQEIAATATLWAAWRAVRRKRGGPGVDGVTLEAFAAQAEAQLYHLRHTLLRRTYRPGELKRVALAKRDGRARHISIPNVRDRVVQQAILHVWGPRFEPGFCDCNYGFRPGRSAHQAVQVIARKLQDGARWVVEADVTDFFDTLDWHILRQALAAQIGDAHVLALIHQVVQSGAMQSPLRDAAQGVLQGAGCSPLMANVYLTGFDRHMLAHGYDLVRYGDDFLVLHRTRQQAETALAGMRDYLENQLRLRLHPDKTGVRDFRRQAVEFLSFRFSRQGVHPAPWAVQRFRDRVQARVQTAPPQDLAAAIARLNPLIRGWGEYFKIGQVDRLFRELDGWVAKQLGTPPEATPELASLVAIQQRYLKRQTPPHHHQKRTRGR
jgi:group II intron reverse transcriptase/maturase